LAKAGPGTVDVLAFRRLSREREEEVIERLKCLVELESPSKDAELLGRLRDDLKARWEMLGLQVRVVKGPMGDHLVGSLDRGGGPPDRPDEPFGPLLVVGHYDTVWAQGETVLQPFRVDGTYAYGPGVFDMKGGIVALELALSLLAQLGVQPAQDLRVVCVADEEVSSPDGRRTVMAEAEGAAAVLGLEPPHADGSFKNGRRGVARVRLEVRGRESHAGLDAAKGVSAVDELVDQLLTLRETWPKTPDAACNIGIVRGGTRSNVVAGMAEAELGLRFSAPATEAALLDALHALRPVREGAEIDVEVLSRRPAWPVGSDVSLANHVIGLAKSLGEEVSARPADGAGDTNMTGASGLPTLDGLGPRGRGAHARGEAVELHSVLARGALLASLIASPLPPSTVALRTRLARKDGGPSNP
jgi:glutamate carboxypeptidase